MSFLVLWCECLISKFVWRHKCISTFLFWEELDHTHLVLTLWVEDQHHPLLVHLSIGAQSGALLDVGPFAPTSKPRLPSVIIIFTTSTILITILIHLSSPLYCRPAGWLVLPTPAVPQFNLFQKSLVRFPKNHLAQKIYVCFTCWHNQHIFKCLVLFVLLFQGLYLSFTSAFPLLPLTLMPDTKNM